MGRLTDFAIRLVTSDGQRARPQALVSRRPPAGATDSPTYSSMPHQPLWPAYEGPSAIAIAERDVYAARCIELIAQSISGLPFQAGNMVSRTPRPTTQLMQLLGPAPGSPNPLWSAAALWRYSIIQYMILGKFAWLHEYDDSGRIVALWPLMSQYLVPVVAAQGAPTYFESFRYGTRGAQGYREFKPDQLTYIFRPSQADIRQPESPFRLAINGLVTRRLLDQFDMAFLSNGGVPSHLVVTPPFEDGTQRRAFRDQFNRKFGGAANAGKPAFAETLAEPGEYGTSLPPQTVDVKVIGQSQKDSEHSTLRDAKIQETCDVFGVPMSLLGRSAASKFTNMQTDRENYWRETVANKITELEDHVNIALAVRMDGLKDVGWFDTSGVPELRKAPVFTEQGGLAAVDAAVITPDEYRADRGLPPLPDGKGAQVKAAVAVAPAPVVEPVVPTLPPVRAVAVRADLLGVVREQLATELADQRHELEQRLVGKRGGRHRAHAQLNLGLAYDVEHWRARLVRNLAPALRAAGLSDGRITDWSEDVTARVSEQLQSHNAMGGVFEPDGYMGSLAEQEPGRVVEAGFLESALLQIHAGQLEAGTVIGELTG